MSGCPEVVRGHFEFSITGDAITVTAKGTTKVRFPSAATPGKFVTKDLTGYSYTVDFNTYPVNAGLGLTTTVNWASVMPHFVYLGNEDDTKAGIFAFSTRNPCMKVTPAVGLINDTDAVGADAQTQNHINSWKADDAGIAAKPCIAIGSFRTTWDTADDRWTLSALTTSDGFGEFNEATTWTFPVGQNGAPAGKTYGVAAGATGLQFTTEANWYTLNRDGVCVYAFSGTDISANGAENSTVRHYLPYTPSSLDTTSRYWATVRHTIGTSYVVDTIQASGGIAYSVISSTTGTARKDNIYTNGSDLIRFWLEIKAF